MKNIVIIFLLSFLIVSCGTQKTVYMGNGKFVTEKKHKRMIKGAYIISDPNFKPTIKTLTDTTDLIK